MNNNQKPKWSVKMSNCAECNAFKRMHPKGGICRANPPTLMVFGMEQISVPGLRTNQKGMRPLTGTGFPEVADDGWCRGFQLNVAQESPKFDVSKLPGFGTTELIPSIGDQQSEKSL